MNLRQRITDAIAARFKAALPDLAGVWVWRPEGVPLAQEELPGMILRDRVCEISIAASQVHEHRLVVEADIYALSIVNVRELTALAWRAIGTDVRWSVPDDVGTLTPLAIYTEPRTDELMAEQGERFLVGARLHFVVIYRAKSFDPSLHLP